jgi:transposase-like protein
MDYTLCAGVILPHKIYVLNLKLCIYIQRSKKRENEFWGLIMSTVVEKAQCKFCGSTKLIRYGCHKNIQRFWCKDCQRKFADNQALPHMKIPSKKIETAVGSYFQGESLLQITHDFVARHGIYISDSTVRKWVETYSKMGACDTQKFHPRTSDTWIINFSIVTIDKSNYWLIDIIDLKSYFILNTTFSESLNLQDVIAAIELAQVRAEKKPKGLIVTGNLHLIDTNQLDKELFKRQNLLVSSNPDKLDEYYQKIKYAYCMRNKIISKLKNKRSVNTIINGWGVHYNFHRIHELLDRLTPAEKAGIDYGFPARYEDCMEQIEVLI